jgi:putative PIN family toxin of toxin-antitoxin system
VKVVVDVNVFVTSVLSSGPSAELVDLWRNDDAFEVVVCPMLVSELGEVLLRPKFRYAIDEYAAQLFVDALSVHGENVDNPKDIPRWSRDPDDDYLVALASENNVDYIISQDKDLLELVKPDIPVITPPEFLRLIRSGG